MKPAGIPDGTEVGATPAAATSILLPGPPFDEPRPRRSRLHFTAVLMSGALLSKGMGFVREILMAQVLGASMAADGFRGAITAVMLPLVFLQNESVPAIMVPMHRDSQRTGDAALQLTALTIALTLVATAIMLVIEALGPIWVGAFVGGFAPETQALTLNFVRIMALAMPASAMLNCLAAGEISIGRSRLTNVRASILNVSVLIGIGLVVWTGDLDALAWAFAFAFNALGGVAVWLLWKERHLTLTGVTPSAVLAAGREFARRLRPLIALPTAEQGHVWIERALASRLVSGSLASLDYARTLTESALVLISQPVGLAVLAHHHGTSQHEEVEAIARPVLAVMVPVSVFLFVFAPEIVGLAFHRGAFDEKGVLLTSQALRGISVGLWAATLGYILLRILNRTRRNAAVAVILVVAYAVNAAVNLGTMGVQETSGAGTMILGLGEAARGCTLLAGAAFALNCGGRLLLLTAIAAIPGALLGLAGLELHAALSGSLERLFAGSLTCVACIGLGALILVPAEVKSLFRKIRFRLARAGKG